MICRWSTRLGPRLACLYPSYSFPGDPLRLKVMRARFNGVGMGVTERVYHAQKTQ